jgi:hypothetical protein
MSCVITHVRGDELFRGIAAVIATHSLPHLLSLFFRMHTLLHTSNDPCLVAKWAIVMDNQHGLGITLPDMHALAKHTGLPRVHIHNIAYLISHWRGCKAVSKNTQQWAQDVHQQWPNNRLKKRFALAHTDDSCNLCRDDNNLPWDLETALGDKQALYVRYFVDFSAQSRAAKRQLVWVEEQPPKKRARISKKPVLDSESYCDDDDDIMDLDTITALVAMRDDEALVAEVFATGHTCTYCGFLVHDNEHWRDCQPIRMLEQSLQRMDATYPVELDSFFTRMSEHSDNATRTLFSSAQRTLKHDFSVPVPMMYYYPQGVY